jgi:hypothetical protein
MPKNLLLTTFADWQLHAGNKLGQAAALETKICQATSLLPNSYKLVRTMLGPKCL